MDSNNNNGGTPKKNNYNYNKKKHRQNRGKKPTRQDRISEAEEFDEAVAGLSDTAVKAENASSEAVSSSEKVQERSAKKPYGKGQKNAQRGDRRIQKPVKVASDEVDASDPSSSNKDDDIAERVRELDSLEENESVSELLMLDGTDDIDIVAEENSENAEAGEGETYEVVGVRFGSASKTYYFDPSGLDVPLGSGVIVETVRGDKYGICNLHNTNVAAKNVFLPLKKVIRIASEEDRIQNEENIVLAEDAFKKCNKKIAEHGLDMKLIEATYTHDRSKLIFFFTAPTRVDFRELVKDLAFIFKTRIDLRQIGIRDEAKMIGGYGICGRPLCCCSFLPNFNQVSIKMAKEQNLSLNTSKISGVCGRLMCCLKFEHKTYLDESKLMPPVGSTVKTADGIGEVTEVSPIAGTVKVKLRDNKDAVPKAYPHADVSVIKRADTGVSESNGEDDDTK